MVEHPHAAVNGEMNLCELKRKTAPFMCHRCRRQNRRKCGRFIPVLTLGYLRVMFAVDDIDETLVRLRKRGAELVGEVVQYKEAYRLCYIRGPEGLLIGLAQELS